MIKPLGDRVVVIPITEESKTKSGICYTGQFSGQPLRGMVLSVGSGSTTLSGEKVLMEVKVDDVVAYFKNGAIDIMDNDKSLVLLREKDILAVYKVDN